MQNQNNGIVWVGILIAIVIAVGSSFMPRQNVVIDTQQSQSSPVEGAVGSRFPNGISVGSGVGSPVQNALLVGANGTNISRINFGFCNIHTGTGITTIAATTTATLDCQAGTGTATALTGVTAGDVCLVMAATTTPTTVEGLSILGVSASSTQGYITLKIFNGTGATYTWASAATSSLNYHCAKVAS